MQLTNLIPQLLAILTVVAQVLSVGLVGLMLTHQRKLGKFKLTPRLMLILAYLVSLAAVGGSLFYSEVMGYPPCKLCWIQRIFMYPQLVILTIALAREKFDVIPYALGLAILGAPVALYHYLLQIGWVPVTECSTVGYSISCSERFTMQFGYITIPMMALSGFVLIILSLKYADCLQKKK